MVTPPGENDAYYVAITRDTPQKSVKPGKG
jgi:hypothetical protein